jgi:hypothetical protein
VKCKDLRDFFYRWVHRAPYLAAVARGEPRVGIDGEPVPDHIAASGALGPVPNRRNIRDFPLLTILSRTGVFERERRCRRPCAKALPMLLLDRDLSSGR